MRTKWGFRAQLANRHRSLDQAQQLGDLRIQYRLCDKWLKVRANLRETQATFNSEKQLQLVSSRKARRRPHVLVVYRHTATHPRGTLLRAARCKGPETRSVFMSYNKTLINSLASCAEPMIVTWNSKWRTGA